MSLPPTSVPQCCPRAPGRRPREVWEQPAFVCGLVEDGVHVSRARPSRCALCCAPRWSESALQFRKNPELRTRCNARVAGCGLPQRISPAARSMRWPLRAVDTVTAWPSWHGTQAEKWSPRKSARASSPPWQWRW